MNRKLDAAIAEVLGHKTEQDINGFLGILTITREEGILTEYDWKPCPRYSTDGNAMLELDREMRKRGWQIDVLYCSNNVCPGITSFSCSYSRKNKYGKREFVHSGRVDNEPFARALAAYKALTGKEWEGE